jgi:3-dehydroquinate synthase
MLERLRVELAERSYPIVIGPGALSDTTSLRGAVAGRQVMVVTNETVAPLYLSRLLAGLLGYQVDTCVIPDGEAFKTLATYEMIMDSLMAHGHHRTSTLVALGGGVVGDISGFAAATYQRGIAFIQVPTTLLAQVDSSVGGKTAVNHPRGKNMIGAFYQPRLVIADTDVLRTLPARELRAGAAEVIKYGIIRDPELFTYLAGASSAILSADDAALTHVVSRSCAIKAQVVAADERESGERALLNFGHTFGHAIEVLTDFKVLHGEAVALGMLMAADLSCRLGMLEADMARQIRYLIESYGLPVAAPGYRLQPDDMLAVMGHDKKVKDGRLQLVLMRSLGDVFVTDAVPHEAIRATLAAAGDLCRGG